MTELVAGFEVQRQLGERTWEALEPGLGRRVALRRLDPGTPFDATAWPERTGVVRLFAVAQGQDGTYIATTFVPGARTLAQLRGARKGRRRRWIEQAEAALGDAVHGRLTADDILVGDDGRAWVTGFGRAPQGATAADDRAALDRLRPPAPRRGRRALAAAGLAAAAAAVLLVAAGGEDPAGPLAPPVASGATAYGSALAAGDLVSVDCEGRAPSGSSLACTIMQDALMGRSLVASGPGLVRAWAVRGAVGRVALQVLREQDGGYVAFNRSRFVTIGSAGRTTVVPADLAVPKGARFALEVAPGSAVGIRRGSRSATTQRFFGPVRTTTRLPDPDAGEGEELLLRVDVEPRVTAVQP